MLSKLRRFILNLRHNVKLGASTKIGKNWKVEKIGFLEVSDLCDLGDSGWISFASNHAKIYIGSGSYIGNYFLASVGGHLVIEDQVMISDRVFIGDVKHNYSDKNTPIISQGLSAPTNILIGSGSWIGVGACILPGVKLGKNCVVAANAVVTKSFPDHSVLAGYPARTIK